MAPCIKLLSRIALLSGVSSCGGTKNERMKIEDCWMPRHSASRRLEPDGTKQNETKADTALWDTESYDVDVFLVFPASVCFRGMKEILGR